MSNRWKIPAEVEKLVKERDHACIYCGIDFSKEHLSRKTVPTWEHIVNDIKINTEYNIALCCNSCNASKGAKKLEDWLQSSYCKNKRISSDSVANVVKMALKNTPNIPH